MPTPVMIVYVVGSMHAAIMLTLVVHHARAIWRIGRTRFGARFWLYPWLLLMPDLLDEQGRYHRLRFFVYTAGAVFSLAILISVYAMLDIGG